LTIMRSLKRKLSRLFAVALVASQAAAYALAPVVEARAATPAGSVSHVEASNDGVCVVVHQPDHCLACQLLSLRSRALQAAPAAIHTPSAVRLAAATTAIAGPRWRADSSPLQPRAPPAASV
jgi:hypothetical protein